ncbi:hypothetical protein E2562_034439, partial [Oryza meyeriana var. granulata]
MTHCQDPDGQAGDTAPSSHPPAHRHPPLPLQLQPLHGAVGEQSLWARRRRSSRHAAFPSPKWPEAPQLARVFPPKWRNPPRLEYLSLVSKVCSELETHIGVGDKVLAEFITELGRDSASVADFDAKLKANGADLPDYFVRTLLTIIHAILPPPSDSRNPSSASQPAAGTS